ncbi:MAG: hypothetical protein E6Q61_08835 [Nitrosomonas sp.]|nr:MAG: hypothetical protein E6Q61_08835 [Nitrosomonas sp.]HNJ37768.1 hypothetical protein [Nitrosomonas sp.]
MINKSIIVLALFLVSCAMTAPKEKPKIFEDQLAGSYSNLARCTIAKLRAEGNWALRSLQFNLKHYKDIEASEVFAYDIRFLPGVFARNSPANPDAVFDYIDPNPSITTYEQRLTNILPGYAFALLIKKNDDTTVNATLEGEMRSGEIAWKHLLECPAKAE